MASVALLTGLYVIIGGAAAIPGATIAVETSVDNELRFFAVFWLAYGGFCLWVARNIKARQQFIIFIALVFFLVGMARLCSILLVGIPNNVLLAAMVLEFILPIVIYYLYRLKN
jgi:hypothetical protein